MRFTPQRATAKDFFTAITDSITREQLTGIGERNARAILRSQLAELVAIAQVSEIPANNTIDATEWDSWTISEQAAYARKCKGYTEERYAQYLKYRDSEQVATFRFDSNANCQTA